LRGVASGFRMALFNNHILPIFVKRNLRSGLKNMATPVCRNQVRCEDGRRKPRAAPVARRCHSLRRLRDGRPAPCALLSVREMEMPAPDQRLGRERRHSTRRGRRGCLSPNDDGARHAPGKCNGRRIRSGCQPCPALCDMAASGLCEARKKAGRESRTGAGLVGLMAPVRRRAIRADSSAEIEIAICARPAQAQIARAD
jgi:hypothetical protein